MKKIYQYLILAGALSLFGFTLTTVVSGTVCFPYQGCTGTNTVPTNGQLLIGNGNGTYTVANLTAGGGIQITNSSGSITVSSTAAGGAGSATTTINQVNGPTFTFYASSSGSDFNIATDTAKVYIAIPTSSASNRGLLSSGDWTTFNNKLSTSTGLGVLNFTSANVGQWTNNLGYLNAASSVTWTAGQTFTGGATFNSTSTHNSSTILIGQTSIGTSTLFGVLNVGTGTQMFAITTTGTVQIYSNNLVDFGGTKYSTSTRTSASPSASVGLSAVGGTTNSFYMPADAAPPLSQSIAPTWTAAHIWTGLGTTTFNTTSTHNSSTIFDGQVAFSDKYPTAGAIPIGTGSSTFTVATITAGTSTVVTNASGSITISSVGSNSHGRVYPSSTPWNLATTSAWTTMQDDKKENDTLNEYSTSTFQFTAQSTGYWVFTAQARVASVNTTSTYQVGLAKNGSTECYSTLYGNVSASNLTMPVSCIIQLNVNDTVRAQVWKNTSGNVSFDVGRVDSFMSWTKTADGP